MTDAVAIRLEAIGSPRAVQELWQKSTGAGSFFTSWTWLGTWLELLPQSERAQLLTVRKGRQRGLALLFARQVRRHRLLNVQQLHFNSTGNPDLDSIFIEHNGFAGLDTDPSIWEHVGAWLLSDQTQADELVIPGVEWTTSLAAGNALKQRRDVPAFRLALKETRAQGSVEAALSRNSRQQLRRAKRAYGPLSLHVAETPERALSYFEALKALHIRSWTRRGKPHAFRYPFFETFHRTLIARGVADGSVRLICVTAGGEPIGYLYNFRHGGTESAYQSGFEDSDPDARPGYVCHALAIENAAAAGIEVYDFLAGANRLKQSFASETYMMSWATLTRPTASLRAAAALGATARAIKSRLQG